MNRTTEQNNGALLANTTLSAAREAAQLNLPLAVDNQIMSAPMESKSASSSAMEVTAMLNPQNMDESSNVIVTDSESLVADVALSLESASLGQRLRAAREARAWSVADTSARLHFPGTIVQALESGDYARIGNGIYLRGYVLSYLRLLGLPISLLENLVERVQLEAPLITTGAISRPRYLYNRYSVPTIYLILTGLIVVPAVWLTTHGGLEQTLVRIAPLDTPAEKLPLNIVPASNTSHSLAAQIASTGTIAPAVEAGMAPASNIVSAETPLVASFTPYMNAKSASPHTPSMTMLKDIGAHHVRLSLIEESWVEILDIDGKRLDYGLLPAGTQHEYYSDSALDIRIGNSNGATLEVDGHAMDLALYRRSNIVRLKLFSDSEKASHSDF